MFYIYPKTQELYDLYDMPSQNHLDDSGIDLYIPETRIIHPWETVLVDLKIVCTCEENGVRQPFWVVPRSSIYKTPLMMKNSIGLVDAGYNGTLKVPLINVSREIYRLEKNTRLVQLVRPDLSVQSYRLKDVNLEPANTTRGTGGFGSTGC